MIKKLLLSSALLAAIPLWASAQTASVEPAVQALSAAGSDPVELKSQHIAQDNTADIVAQKVAASRDVGKAAIVVSEGKQLPAGSQVNNKVESMKPLEGNFAAGNVTAPSRKGVKPGRKAAAQFTPGSTVYAAEFDYSYSTGARSTAGVLNFVINDDGTAELHNLWGLTDTLQATIDTEAGTVSITPALVYTHSTYGELWAVPFNSSTHTYSTTSPITGTIAQDGTITLAPWGIFVVSGDYRGGTFGYYSKSELKLTNATMSDVIYDGSDVTVTDSVTTYAVYLDQTLDNQVEIVNFTNNGATVKMRLRSDSTAVITPQRIFTNALYGAFNCMPANWEKSKSGQKGNIQVTSAPGEVYLPNWGVFCEASTDLSARRVISTTLKYDDGALTYPAPTQQDWTGNGTEASPYVITNVTQFTAFSEQVDMGDDFKGKHVALGADIDFSAATTAYVPVGSTTTPFRGTFDGKGYTIKNFTLSTGGENYQGIFGVADTTSVIKNFNIDAATMSVGGMYNGVVAGASSGVIKDITMSSATLTFSQSMGAGIVGYFNGSELSNIEAKATITGVGENAIIVGELVGDASASNLVAHGSISVSSVYNTMYTAVGGVVGSTLPVSDREPVIEDCYSDATINATAAYARVGGVVGELVTGTLNRCFNTGNLSAAATYQSVSGSTSVQYLGAIGGISAMVYGGTMKNSYNAGAIINTGNSTRVGGIFAYTPMPTYRLQGGDTIYVSFQSHIEKCYNSGYVYAASSTETMGLFGSIYKDNIVESLYYDRQLVGSNAPARYSQYELETAALTSGELPSGFDAAVWTATAGLYPRIKGLDENPAARLSASPMTLDEGQDVNKVKGTFSVSNANNIVWKIYSGSSFTDSSTGLTINGEQVTLNEAYSTEILAALSTENTAISKLVRIKTINPSSFDGMGTEANPYLIRTKADLIALDEAVSTYGQTFKNDYFKQVNDIDIAAANDFQGIGMGGQSTRVFNATYDGDGHKISGLKIAGIVNDDEGKASSSLSQIAVAFIGFTGPNAVVKNLTMDSDCEFDAYSYASSVVAVNYGKVTNCKNFAPVNVATSYAGGIVALNQSTGEVSDCYNAATIQAGTSYAAGIAAGSAGSVLYCQNNGAIVGDSINPLRAAGTQNAVAGIVANNGSNSRIVGCVNAGPVYAHYNVGGITTSHSSGEFSGNINYGTVDRKQSTHVNRGAMLSTVPGSSVTVENNYYDAQIASYGAAASTTYAGLNGVNTIVLTSGEALDGLDAARYDLVAGQYPVLKAFKDEEAVVAHRKMVITFDNGQSTDDMRTDATLYQADDLQWSIADGTKFTIAGNTLSVNIGDDLTSVRDTLTAVVGSYYKVLPLRAMPVLFDGAGTQDDPFQIKTKDDMLKLAAFTNNELYPFTGKYFKVMNDIDFGETTFECVGVEAGSFNAVFDGDGKSFYNITNAVDKNTRANRGMFGNLGENGVIRNVVLASGTIMSYRGTGAIVGVAYGRVENCENHARVTGTTTSGTGGAGIAGTVKAGGVVTNCRNYGEIAVPGGQDAGIAWTVEAGGRVENCVNEAAISLAKASIAGIAVYNAGVIDGCVNNGALGASGTVGGIVATSRGGDTIVNCVNHGEIIATGANTGGILAVNTTKSEVPTIVTNCHNDAALTGRGYLGGVAGRLYSGIHMTDCYNVATVTSTTGTNIGGVAGSVTGVADYTTIVERCYNTANVTAAGNYTGGAFGNFTANAIVRNCYNTGNVTTSGNFSAGFSGSVAGEVYDSYNAGNVTAGGYGIGGFAGLGAGTAVRVFNLGDVKASGNNKLGVAGGIWGYGRPTIKDSYNMGTVDGAAYVGGIAGGVFSDITIENCYNAGVVLSDDESLGGNIAPSTDTQVSIVNTFFDNEVGKVYGSTIDAKAVGQTTRQLTLNEIVDSVYNVIPGMYPTLINQSDNELANFYAAVPVLAEGETAQAVESAIVIGVPEGTTWTCSDNIYLSDGVAYGTATGEAWLTKTYADREETYYFNILTPSGIDDIDAAGATIVSTQYYGVNGAVLGSDKPSQAGIYIQVTTHSDGTRTTRKVRVK